MRTFDRVQNEVRYEAIKNLVSEGVITDLEKLQRAFKISKKEMDDFMKRMAAEK